MNIPKAIEIKENHQHFHLAKYSQEFIEADRLSIEALQAIINYRARPYYNTIKQLPSETED